MYGFTGLKFSMHMKYVAMFCLSIWPAFQTIWIINTLNNMMIVLYGMIDDTKSPITIRQEDHTTVISSVGDQTTSGKCDSVIYHDVIKWKHFPRYWPIVSGIHSGLENSPHKGQWRRALMYSLICNWINGWVNNCEAGELRCHCAHYDVIVMT